jgi:hypothetical protein
MRRRRTTRESFSKTCPQRHHAHVEHARLELAQLAIEVLLDLAEVRADARRARVGGEPRDDGADGVAMTDELADEVHQQIELRDVDAHGSADRSQGLDPAALAGRRSGGRGGSQAARVEDAHRALRVIDPPGEELRSEVRRDEQAEADLAFGARGRRGEGRDDLARLAQRRGDLAEPLLEGREIERRFDRNDGPPAPKVLAQAVLLVFRQGPEQRRIEAVEIGVPPHFRRGRRQRAIELGEEAFGPERRRLLGRNVTPEVGHEHEQDRNAFVEQADDGRAQIDPAEPQAVEDVLEAVGDQTHGIETGETRETFQRVGGAEESVDQIGFDLAVAVALLVQQAEIPAHLLEELFGLGDELAAILRGRRAHARGSSAGFPARLSGARGSHGRLLLSASSPRADRGRSGGALPGRRA